MLDHFVSVTGLTDKRGQIELACEGGREEIGYRDAVTMIKEHPLPSQCLRS